MNTKLQPLLWVHCRQWPGSQHNSSGRCSETNGYFLPVVVTFPSSKLDLEQSPPPVNWFWWNPDLLSCSSVHVDPTQVPRAKIRVWPVFCTASLCWCFLLCTPTIPGSSHLPLSLQVQRKTESPYNSQETCPLLLACLRVSIGRTGDPGL